MRIQAFLGARKKKRLTNSLCQAKKAAYLIKQAASLCAVVFLADFTDLGSLKLSAVHVSLTMAGEALDQSHFA